LSFCRRGAVWRCQRLHHLELHHGRIGARDRQPARRDLRQI